ncbi:MAG: tRNA-dihydrouridine synthase [Lentisphaeria bacterium]|nr:tRNA-dihydrouridine synthase [Lentisphaeria bacterium]
MLPSCADNTAACSGTPLILNGDIASAAEARRLAARTGCAGVMCARTWMRDPFLLRRIEGAEVPGPEAGRELFYAELLRSGVGGGARVELAKLLFGADDPHFLELVRK